MSAFSTTSYYPFDSEAPTLFRNTQMSNYLSGEWLISRHRLHLMLAHSQVAFLVWQFNLLLAFELTHTHLADIAALRSRYHSGQGGTMSVI
jgi:hypothetical protein